MKITGAKPQLAADTARFVGTHTEEFESSARKNRTLENADSNILSRVFSDLKRKTFPKNKKCRNSHISG
ncbi:hypothetical protein DLM75_18065 [Leptospira stimsonii]|uniref:Uncharacterized protein n=1 Tax=Leptospira stimsonii TaxID=2202203 RepID=A0A396YXU3_9LEPT|nr:hypothetical protein DLM75_18065 [Leptospira stimsonii]